MIIEALLGLVAWIIDALLFPLQIDSLPVRFAQVIAEFISVVVRACSIIAAYIDTAYILALLGFVISFNAAILAFDIVFFIVKKIPFINIH